MQKTRLHTIAELFTLISTIRQTDLGSTVFCMDEHRQKLEEAARARVGAAAGRALNEAEWAKAKRALIEYALLLGRWEYEESIRESVQSLPLAA